MTVPDPQATAPDDGTASGHDAAAPDAPVDRAVLDRVFGTVLPDVTRDERDLGGDGRRASAVDDSWYRENRPPHHG